jgi:hypothetical protein
MAALLRQVRGKKPKITDGNSNIFQEDEKGVQVFHSEFTSCPENSGNGEDETGSVLDRSIVLDSADFVDPTLIETDTNTMIRSTFVETEPLCSTTEMDDT